MPDQRADCPPSGVLPRGVGAGRHPRRGPTGATRTGGRGSAGGLTGIRYLLAVGLLAVLTSAPVVVSIAAGQAELDSPAPRPIVADHRVPPPGHAPTVLVPRQPGVAELPAVVSRAEPVTPSPSPSPRPAADSPPTRPAPTP